MATVLSIDETTGVQSTTNDIALPSSGDVITALNTYFGNTSWTSTVLQAAKKTGALTNLQNTIDLALTNSSGGNLNGVDSGLNDLSGADILLYTDPTNNNLVLGKVGGTVMFAIYLDATGSSTDAGATAADLWMVEFQPIQHPDSSTPNDFVSIHEKIYTTVTNPISFDATKAPSGSSLFVAVGDGSPLPTEVGVIVTAVGAANQSVTGNISSGEVVKASQAGSSLGGATFGIGSQQFNGPGGSAGADGDLAYFTFVKGLATGLTVPNLDQNESDVESNIGFSQLFGATKASFVVCQLQGGGLATVKIKALVAGVQSTGATSAISDDVPWTGENYIDHQDQNTQVDIDKVTVVRGSATYTFTEGANPTLTVEGGSPPSNLNVNFNVDGGLGAVIEGLAEGDKVVYESTTEHDRLQISNPGGSSAAFDAAFDIGAIKIEAGGTSSSLLGDIDVYDDGPTIGAVTNTNASVRHDETAGVQSDTDVAGTAFVTGSSGATVASLFSSIGGTAIGYARSGGSMLTSITGSAGTDGPGALELSYGLSVADGTYSGVETTGGTRIFMYAGTGAQAGLILGRVGNEVAAGDTANANGAIAFALAVNPLTGEVFQVQYASLKHPTGNGTSYDETISLADGAVQATVSRTDGDGDKATDSNNNIGLLVRFDDDGPALTPQGAGSATPNNLVVKNATDSTGQDSSSYGLLPGADGKLGPVSFSILGPEDSSGDFTWQYFNVDGVNGLETNEIKGFYKGNALYTLELEETGSYTFKMVGTLPGSTIHLTSAEIKAGAPDTNSIEVGAIENDQYVSITGDSTVAGAAGNINESNGNVGIDNGNLDTGETLVFTLHNGDGSQVNFSGMNIGTKAPASSYHVVANLVGGGTYEFNVSLAKDADIIVDPPGNVMCTSVEITKLSGSATKIGLDDIDIFVQPPDVVLDFGVKLTDGDGDFTTTNFTVSIDGDNNGSITSPISGAAALTAASLVDLNSSDTMSASIWHPVSYHDYLM